MRPEHKPIGDPCVLCKCPANEHRVYHLPEGDPCSKCGLPAENHRSKTEEQRKQENVTLRTPKESRAIADKKYRSTEKGKETRRQASATYRAKHPGYKSRAARVEEHAREVENLSFIGIDGEGQGRDPHCYVYLAASTLDGSRTWSVESKSWRESWNPETKTYSKGVKSLSTMACFDFLLALPKKSRLFAFSFNYDLTKILTEIPDERLYTLFRPEMRQRKRAELGPAPIKWKGYQINLIGSQFKIANATTRKTVWDIFKFYGTKFVKALETWKVGDKAALDRMTLMKDKRGEFDKEDPDSVSAYCLEECRFMAQLAQKLVVAHNEVDLPLKQFHGAGSSAAVMLTKMGIKEKICKLPKAMDIPLSMAFFGGRFENSRIGVIEQKVYNKDISSAYPYQLMFLPCLEHGTWRLTKRRKDIEGRTALVHYGLDDRQTGLSKFCKSWGPFPYRDTDGSICFPSVSGGGWVYGDEYRAGERLFPHVRFREAWIHEADCNCQPFRDIAHYYLYRIFLGKEGRGHTIKLAVNSCYGKLAQSIGNPKFNSWVWAGLITSGCRAQILEVMALASDLRDVLMIATDGIASLSPIPSTTPKDTGTAFLLGADGRTIDPTKPNPKPLGGWEDKNCDKGMFLARPGVYFPLNPTDDEINDVRGRGLGKGIILANHEKIVNSWRKHGASENLHIANVSRFCGAKSSISISGKRPKWTFTRANGSQGAESPKYGDWVNRVVEMGFDPHPKRESEINADGTLTVRRMPMDRESMPYKKAECLLTDPEVMMLKKFEQEMLEQPEVDFSEFGEMMGVEL